MVADFVMRGLPSINQACRDSGHLTAWRGMSRHSSRWCSKIEIVTASDPRLPIRTHAVANWTVEVGISHTVSPHSRRTHDTVLLAPALLFYRRPMRPSGSETACTKLHVHEQLQRPPSSTNSPASQPRAAGTHHVIMKLTGFLLPTLVGLASAQHPQQEAEVYLIRQSSTPSSSSTRAPSVPSEVAAAILRQHLLTRRPYKLPEDIDDESISYVSRFAAPIRPLFPTSQWHEPKQLVVVLNGVDETNVASVRKALPSTGPDFTSSSISRFWSSESRCSFPGAIDPDHQHCWASSWSEASQYYEYDLASNSEIVSTIAESLAALQDLAKSGDLETTIVLMPAGVAHPDEETLDELRRRDMGFQSEQIIHDEDSDPNTTPSTLPNPPPYSPPSKGAIQACYQSQNVCETATDHCSGGHGLCRNRFEADGNGVCFACHCLSTSEKTAGGGNVTTHWAGATCQKIDISSPFWLLTGLTIVLFGAVTFCIYLLFAVGEEKLPGVIGAGVSRGGSK